MKYTLEKIYAWIKWALAIAVQFMLFPFSLVLYPILIYPTRRLIRFFWYECGKFGKVISFLGFTFLNDPDSDGKCDDYGSDKYRKSLGYEQPIEELNWLQKWWISYNWSGWRNWAWNSHRFLKPKYNYWLYQYEVDPVIASAYKKFNIQEVFDTKKSKYVEYFMSSTFADPMDWCVLKYKFKDGTEADNFGDIIDLNKSVLGKIFVYYRVKGVLYFRYSRAWYDPNTGKAREIQLGTNGSRFKIRYKIKKLKE